MTQQHGRPQSTEGRPKRGGGQGLHQIPEKSADEQHARRTACASHQEKLHVRPASGSLFRSSDLRANCDVLRAGLTGMYAMTLPSLQAFGDIDDG